MSHLDDFVKGTTSGTDNNETPSVQGVTQPGKFDSSPSLNHQKSLNSSSPQIYPNLLILEASLRAQWLQLQTRKRQHTFFLTLLACWITYFGYALFLAPREDGSGVGGSVYWVVEVLERLSLLGGIVTGVLVWGTGQWDRGVRWPRRWVYITNRGLRGFNCKLVVIKKPWWSELYSIALFKFSYGLFTGSSENSNRRLNQTRLQGHEKVQNSEALDIAGIKKDINLKHFEEDLTPGGDHIKLLLLPKPFSAKFREDWDIYRTEYWEEENARRATLQKILRDRERRIAKHYGGFFWWFGFRGWSRGKHKLNDRADYPQHKHGPTGRGRQRLRSKSLRSRSYSRNPSEDLKTSVDLIQKLPPGQSEGSSSVRKVSERRNRGIEGSSQGNKVSNPRAAIPEVPSSLIKQQNSISRISPVDIEYTSKQTSTLSMKAESPQLGKVALSQLKASRGNSMTKKLNK